MPYKEGKKWRGVVTKDGQRYTKLKDTKKKAIEWEAKKRKELKRDERRMQQGPDLLDLCSKYLIFAERYVKNTQGEKRYLCKRLLKEFGPERPVESITRGEIQGFLDAEAKERSPNAANRDRKNVCAMWNKYGVPFLGLKNNPTQGTVRFTHDREPQYTPPTKDILAVLAVATRKEKVFLNAYIQTAARRSEIFRWTWSQDINFSRREYRLGTRKTKSGEMQYDWFPMSTELHESLKWWHENRKFKDVDWVFPNDRPGPGYKKPYTGRRTFLFDLCDRAKVQRFGFHALRRYVASYLADTHKVSAKTIQRILRHKALSTTERYIHNINSDLEGVMNMISEPKYTKPIHEAKKKGAADEG